MKFSVRALQPDDLNFVMDAWLNSWRTHKYSGCIPNHLYYNLTRETIESLLARGAKIVVADEGRTLLGFACGEVKSDIAVVHYLYIKDPYVSAAPEIAGRLLDGLPGAQPGFHTFFNYRLDKAKWKHAPEMVRREKL